MKDYKDNNNILRNILLSQDNMMCLEEDEFEMYRTFINDKKRGKKFSIDQFGYRLAVKNNQLYNLLSPFFYGERFINYTKVNKILIREALDDNYRDFTVSLAKPLYIIGMIPISGSQILTLTLKYLKVTEKDFQKINEKSDRYQISDEHPDNDRSMLFVKKNFRFKITDTTFLFSPMRNTRYTRYIHFDEVMMCPAGFIENNETNKRNILSVTRKHGMGMGMFVRGMKFTEAEAKKIILPAIQKTRTSFMYRSSKERVFLRLLETQSHLSDGVIMEILTKLSGNKPFMRKLKSSKRIAKVYKNRPTILLFMIIS